MMCGSVVLCLWLCAGVSAMLHDQTVSVSHNKQSSPAKQPPEAADSTAGIEAVTSGALVETVIKGPVSDPQATSVINTVLRRQSSTTAIAAEKRTIDVNATAQKPYVGSRELNNNSRRGPLVFSAQNKGKLVSDKESKDQPDGNTVTTAELVSPHAGSSYGTVPVSQPRAVLIQDQAKAANHKPAIHGTTTLRFLENAPVLHNNSQDYTTSGYVTGLAQNDTSGEYQLDTRELNDKGKGKKENSNETFRGVDNPHSHEVSVTAPTLSNLSLSDTVPDYNSSDSDPSDLDLQRGNFSVWFNISHQLIYLGNNTYLSGNSSFLFHSSQEDGKPFLHPRTNIFNDPAAKTGGSINKLNQPSLIRQGGPKLNMESAEQTTVADAGGGPQKEEIPDNVLCPEWPKGKHELGVAWALHPHPLAVAFLIVAVYSVVTVVRLRKKKHLLSRVYFITLNVLIFIVGLMRTIYLFVDAYNCNSTFPLPLVYVIHRLPMPCLAAAFSILFLALLQTTKVRILSGRIQKPKVLIAVLVFYFLLNFIIDVVVGASKSREVLLVVQILFILFSVCFSVGYIIIFRKLYVSAKKRQKEMLKLMLRKASSLIGDDAARKIKSRLTLNAGIKVTLSTAIMCLLMAFFQIYAAASIHNPFSDARPEPWPWWVCHTAFRLIELGMCITMSYVATQPFRYDREAKGACGRFLQVVCLPCRRIISCRRQSDTDPSQFDINWSQLPNSSEASQLITNKADDYPLTDGVNGHATIGSNNNGVSAKLLGDHNQVNDVQTDTALNENTLGPGDLYGKGASPIGDRHCEQYAIDPAALGEPETITEKHSSRGSRPSSLLINDNGFIRVRRDGETDGVPVVLSTDDELGSLDLDTAFANASKEQNNSRGGASPAFPMTGQSTPISPKSVAGLRSIHSSEFSFDPPSSINLRRSIDRAMNAYDMRLETPDSALSDDVYMGRGKLRPLSPDVSSADELSSPQEGESVKEMPVRHQSLDRLSEEKDSSSNTNTLRRTDNASNNNSEYTRKSRDGNGNPSDLPPSRYIIYNASVESEDVAYI